GAFALIGIPIVLSGEHRFQILNTLGARQSCRPGFSDVAIVRCKLVRLVDHLLAGLVHRQRVSHTRKTEIGASVWVTGVDNIDPLALRRLDPSLPKQNFTESYV